jgi:hypothetical protein
MRCGSTISVPISQGDPVLRQLTVSSGASCISAGGGLPACSCSSVRLAFSQSSTRSLSSLSGASLLLVRGTLVCGQVSRPLHKWRDSASDCLPKHAGFVKQCHQCPAD